MSESSIACLLVTHLPVKAERRRWPGLRGQPLVIAGNRGARVVVLDSSPESVGVTAGMPVSEVVALPADGPYYGDVFDRMADALARRCPSVEKAGMGRPYTCLEGLDPLYGGEARMIASLIQAVPTDFEPQPGVAPSGSPPTPSLPPRHRVGRPKSRATGPTFGVTAGMHVREALGRCPEVVALPADGPYYGDVFDWMADALARRCPVVERAGMGRLYSGEARMIASLIQAVPTDFEPQPGVAPVRFAACALAAATTPGRAANVTGHGADFRRGRRREAGRLVLK